MLAAAAFYADAACTIHTYLVQDIYNMWIVHVARWNMGRSASTVYRLNRVRVPFASPSSILVSLLVLTVASQRALSPPAPPSLTA